MIFVSIVFTRNTDVKSQSKALSFQPDDIVILEGYPKLWQGMELLNVRLVIKIPAEANNSLIPRGRALASHQCGPGSIPGLGVITGPSLLVLYSAPRHGIDERIKV